ncbi:hypothetical protein BRADI_1g63671v3 [Brachypodium distachyon]|uniref:Ricin B lectin domain-containing protein n=1 Tax=Brachypodium distachyon TaxID=15368 RepID=A0A2K2DT96_BRADI|nr:hypothetical protein BRADI_1g63671v3 [Brachypodium distachyon]
MAYTLRIRCRASDDHSLAIVDGEVILTNADPNDDRQLWYKDVRYAEGLKDEAGSPAFALVNKATGDALKHSFGYNLPVRAIKFDPGYLDESVLWAESEDLADGFRRIRMVNNTDYIFDAEKAIPRYGGVRDGTRLILYRWNGGKNQLWEIAPTAERAQHVRIVCQCNQDLSLAVRDGTAVLARTDHEEETQCWIQSFRNTGRVTDQEGHRPFALVNRATGEALRRPRATSRYGRFLQLAMHQICVFEHTCIDRVYVRRFKSSATARTRSTWRFCGRGATTLEKGSITSGASATSVLYWMRQRAGLNPEGRMTARLSSYSRPTLA